MSEANDGRSVTVLCAALQAQDHSDHAFPLASQQKGAVGSLSPFFEEPGVGLPVRPTLGVCYQPDSDTTVDLVLRGFADD